MMNEHVLERLNEGSIRWLSVKWLLDRPADFVLPRRQELERDTGALIAGEAAVSLLRSKRVAALSTDGSALSIQTPMAFTRPRSCASSVRSALRSCRRRAILGFCVAPSKR